MQGLQSDRLRLFLEAGTANSINVFFSHFCLTVVDAAEGDSRIFVRIANNVVTVHEDVIQAPEGRARCGVHDGSRPCL